MEKIKNLKILVVDNDDVMFASSPWIQYHVERNFPQFASARLLQRERIIRIIGDQLDRVTGIIQEAKTKGEIPKLPDFNKMNNDVIKTDLVKSDDYEEEYYRKPINEIQEALNLAKYDKEMFLEERDATVEADGKLEHGVIPYDEIYAEKNWIPYVKSNIQKLYEMFGERVISLTAHNGIDDMHGREFEEKGKAVHKMVPDMAHYGLRFHDSEHVPGIRRDRNSKSKKIMQIYGYDDMHGVVLLDDSLANCLDIYSHGGTPILVSQSGKNDYGFATVKSLKPESILRELEKLGFMSDNEYDILQKPKVLRK